MTTPERHYYKQLHRHDPDEGLIGDCWRTCIANLLGLKPQQVPHFLEDHWQDGHGGDAYIVATKAWLAKRNLQIVEICLDAYDPNGTRHFGDALYILGGQTDESGIGHVCIGKGHFQVVHNPATHLKPFGPLRESDQDCYWVIFLVPINLAEFAKISFPDSAESAIVIPSANDSTGHEPDDKAKAET